MQMEYKDYTDVYTGVEYVYSSLRVMETLLYSLNGIEISPQDYGKTIGLITNELENAVKGLHKLLKDDPNVVF